MRGIVHQVTACSNICATFNSALSLHFGSIRNSCRSGFGRTHHQLRFPACPLLFRQSFAEQEAVVQAVAIHAGVFAHEDQPDDEALNLAAAPVTMDIKTAAAWALAGWGPRF
jgi:hypothetical protein